MLGPVSSPAVIAIDVSHRLRRTADPAQSVPMSPDVRDLPACRRRLRRVMEHLGTALSASEPSEALRLSELARIACWSPEHFDRVYRRWVGEPPMATVRRLRLQAAARELRAGHRLADVADRAGYGSTQAFGRAFERLHGAPPTTWLRGRGAAASDDSRLVIVRLADDMPCHRLAYRGPARQVSNFFDEVIDRLQRSGSPRAQWQVLGVSATDDVAGHWERRGGEVVLWAAVLAAPLSHAPRGLEPDVLQGGWHLRLPAGSGSNAAHALHGLDDRLHEAGWQRTDGPVLRHYDTDPAVTAPPERREWLYVPIATR